MNGQLMTWVFTQERISQVCKLLCAQQASRWKTCEPVQLQEGSLPSDGSGIDPHATLLVVQPVSRNRTELHGELRGGRGGLVVCHRVTYRYYRGRRTGLLCPVTSSFAPCLLNPASLLYKRRLAAAALTLTAAILDGRLTDWKLHITSIKTFLVWATPFFLLLFPQLISPGHASTTLRHDKSSVSSCAAFKYCQEQRRLAWREVPLQYNRRFCDRDIFENTFTYMISYW